MAQTSTKPTIKIVRVTEAHAPQVAEFYRKVWDPEATPESVRDGRAADARANPALRGADIPTYILLSDETILGYCSTIPVRVWLPSSRTEIDAAWVKGLMVLPEQRNGPIGVMVAKELVKHHPVLLSLTVQVNAQRLFTALGFKQSGAMPSALRILRPGAVLRSLDLDRLGLSGIPGIAKTGVRWVQKLGLSGLAGLAVKVGFGLKSALAPGGSGLRIVPGKDPTAEELDRLWIAARPADRAAVIRDAAYLQYRYRGAERDDYTTVCARRTDGSLAGVAYVKQPRGDTDPRLRGIRIATLSDLVFDVAEPSAAAALIKGAERVASELGAHAIMSSASVPGLPELLRSRAWLRMPATFHFSTHDMPGTESRFPASLDQWWLTRGDGGSDGGL
ncbi:MAG TPA: hypothetical protein VIP11_06450 [Gemmatimonadaceae bacterium]